MVVWVKVVVGGIVMGVVEKVEWVIAESEAHFVRQRGIYGLYVRQFGIRRPFSFVIVRSRFSIHLLEVRHSSRHS